MCVFCIFSELESAYGEVSFPAYFIVVGSVTDCLERHFVETNANYNVYRVEHETLLIILTLSSEANNKINKVINTIILPGDVLSLGLVTPSISECIRLPLRQV